MLLQQNAAMLWLDPPAAFATVVFWERPGVFLWLSLSHEEEVMQERSQALDTLSSKSGPF